MDKRIDYRQLTAVLLGSLVFALGLYFVGLAPPLEVIGFVTGVTGVWLAAKNHIWSWPVGLLNSAAYIYVYLEAHLYPDVGLFAFFFISGIYGWYWWLKGGEKRTEAPITSVPRSQWAFTSVLGVVSALLITRYMYHINSAAPFFDTALVVGSVIAQYWMTRRYIECWLLWITVDVFFVPLYWWKGLYLTGWLFAIYLVLAYFGLRQWSRERKDVTSTGILAQPYVRALFAIGALVWAGMAWFCLTFELRTPANLIATYKRSAAAPIYLEREILDPRSGAVVGSPQRLSAEAQHHFVYDLLDPLLYKPISVASDPNAVPVQRLRFLEKGKDGEVVEHLRYEIFLDHARVKGQNQSLNVWERVKRYLPAP